MQGTHDRKLVAYDKINAAKENNEENMNWINELVVVGTNGFKNQEIVLIMSVGFLAMIIVGGCIWILKEGMKEVDSYEWVWTRKENEKKKQDKEHSKEGR